MASVVVGVSPLPRLALVEAWAVCLWVWGEVGCTPLHSVGVCRELRGSWGSPAAWGGGPAESCASAEAPLPLLEEHHATWSVCT